jgi:hypothetical protein
MPRHTLPDRSVVQSSHGSIDIALKACVVFNIFKSDFFLTCATKTQISMRILFISALSIFLSFHATSQLVPWEHELVAFNEGETEHVIMGTEPIRSGVWAGLPQPLFWQQIMLLSPDSVLVNIASNRQIVAKMSNRRWKGQTDVQKAQFKDSVKFALGLPAEERIMVTTGKNDFYRFDLVFESLPKGVQCFNEYGVDPWYAQSILLIESPGHMAKSTAGAYGPFQLMPGVARSMGLTVNKTLDERKDFNRSAYGASQLLKRICIPSARSIAGKAGLTVDEQAIWFRLLVMHVYHAGSLNVQAVVEQIGQVQTGEELIQRMWVTTAASFGNSSQNYSQLALAAHMQLGDILKAKNCSIYSCTEFTTEGE